MKELFKRYVFKEKEVGMKFVLQEEWTFYNGIVCYNVYNFELTPEVLENEV
jgi:hypothetical protein